VDECKPLTAGMQLAKPEMEVCNAMIKENPGDTKIQQQAKDRINKIFAKYNCHPAYVGHLLPLYS
jgi:membrane protein insertase Oxa1/YidC/SpoIIIJ